MNKTISATVLSLMTLLEVTPAFSQSLLTTRIPFDFNVGRSHLSAGDYTVRLFSPGVLRITRQDGKESCGVLTLFVQGKSAPTEAKLIFNKYGSHYFLTQVWNPGELQGRELLKSTAEKELAQNATGPKQTMIYASAAKQRPLPR